MIETRRDSATAKRVQKLTRESQNTQIRWRRFFRDNKFTPSPRCYNLTISTEPKFVWFRNAKVGTRSIFQALDDSGITLAAEHSMDCHYSPSYYEDYFKFAFVRNPWTRLASCWSNKIQGRNAFGLDKKLHAELQTFSKFIDFVSTFDLETCNSHFRSQSALIDLNEIDFLGRMETFDEDVQIIFKNLNLPCKSVPKANRSRMKGQLSLLYSDVDRERVGDLYRKDVQVFGYNPSTPNS